MRQLDAEALILDVVDLHDGDRIVSFLTAEHGQKRGAARGAKRKYSRFAGQLQLLAKVSVGWFEKEGRDLVRIQEVEVRRSAEHLHRSLERLLAGSYLAEHMRVFAQENEPSPRLFRLLDSTLQALEAGVDLDLAVRYFEAWLLRLTGVFPPPRECADCGSVLGESVFLPPQAEGLRCGECQRLAPTGLRVGRPALDFLHRIGGENLASLQQRPCGDEVLREVEELCGRVRRSFLGHELRSYDVMRRSLAEVGSAAGDRVQLRPR